MVDFVYSNQLLEHLHPEGCRGSTPGDPPRSPARWSVCVHNHTTFLISIMRSYFDYEATCLRPKEYDYGLIAASCSASSDFELSPAEYFDRGWGLRLPCVAMRTLEYSLLDLPPKIRVPLTEPSLVQAIMGLNVIAEK
jgi:hypothetical protein